MQLEQNTTLEAPDEDADQPDLTPSSVDMLVDPSNALAAANRMDQRRWSGLRCHTNQTYYLSALKDTGVAPEHA